MKRIPPRRGMMLLEIFAVLMFAGAAMIVATWVANNLFQELHEAPQKDWQSTATQSLLTIIRQDTWGAAEITRTSPQAIRLVWPGGRTIDWSVDDDGTITRTDAETHHWQHFAPGLTFSVDAMSLTLNWPAGSSTDAIGCVSQLRLADGGGK